jgi:signal transduction histidine kinase
MENSIEIRSIFWIGTFVMLCLALGLVFLVMFYMRHYAKMKQNEAELLLKTALESEKKERQRIAKDLHDSVQGDISAIRNYLALLSRTTTDLSIKPLIETIKTTLNQTAENTRLISYKLMPPLLETAGFCATVLDHFEKLSQSTGKLFSIKADLSELAIPVEQAYELFRVVQEFTQNMLKYGSISECKLFLYETEMGISIEIVDDGIPFDFKKSFAQSKGSGLLNIKSRLTSIDAQLIQREVVGGNHFVITLNKKI